VPSRNTPLLAVGIGEAKSFIYAKMPNVDAMVATGINTPVAKVAAPKQSRAVFSSIDSLLRSSKPEPDGIPRQALASFSFVRKNDDIMLLFQHDGEEKYYLYAAGRLRNGTSCVGLMPYHAAESHKDVVREMMRQFNARVRQAKGGMLAIHNGTIYIFGTSGRYHDSDHESVANAIRKLVPEADRMELRILHSLKDVPAIEGL